MPWSEKTPMSERRQFVDEFLRGTASMTVLCASYGISRRVGYKWLTRFLVDGDRALMDAVYAAVPASLVGRQQEIEVGPMSGRSNVIFWLESRNLPATDEIVDRIFAAAKASNRVLSHEKVQSIVGGEAKIEPGRQKLETARRRGF